MKSLPFLLSIISWAFCASAEAALPAWSEKASQAWWATRPSPIDFPAEAAKLKDALLEIQLKPGADLTTLSANSNFLGWLELAAWLELWPEKNTGEFFTSEDGKKAFTTVGNHAVLRRMFLSHLSAFDDAPKACEILCRIAQKFPELSAKYPQVAIAFALVWDQPFPETWPHPWISKENLPMGDSDPVKRFDAYFKIQQGFEVNPGMVKKLEIDPSKLSARDLMFVVDTPIELKEIAYALQVKLSDPRKLNELFQQIPYDSTRMSRTNLMWPHGAYRLIEIGKKGGICADQAFFVSMTGKAQGIPTVMLMGQGTSGGHAWVGYMGSAGKWTMDVAKYADQHYTAGSTYDPQTWKRITDAQMDFLNKQPDADSPASLRGHLLTRWAMMNHDSEWYPRLLGIARTAWPHSFDVWELQASCLEEKNIPSEQRRVFWESWINTFREDRDTKFKGQMALLSLHETNGDQASADKLRAAILTENKRARFDLAITLAASPILDLARSDKWPEASTAYEKLLGKSKSKSNGDLFYNLVQPYLEQAIQAGQKDLARQALLKAKPLFQVQPLSTLAVDIKALEAAIQ